MSDTKRKACPFCNESFNDEMVFNAHVVKCFNGANNKCHHCGKIPLTITELCDLKNFPIPEFTGRCFCSQSCFYMHLLSEGFDGFNV